MDSRSLRLSYLSGDGSTGESEESERESSSDTDETASTEQSTRNVDAVGSCRWDYVDPGPVIGLGSGESGDRVGDGPVFDRLMPAAPARGSRLRARVPGRRVGSKPARGTETVRRLRECSQVARGTPSTASRGGKGSLTKEQRAAVGGLVSRGVTIGTRRGYERHWDRWTGFLQTIPEWQRPSDFLVEVEMTLDKIGWLSLFIVHLYNVHGIRDPQRVSAVLSGLRLMWRVQRLDTGFFDHPDLVAAKKGVRPTIAEVRNNEVRRAETRKLPAIAEVMAAMRERLWLDTGVDPNACI